MINKEYSSDVRGAIICFQFSERIKSELIITARLLGEIGELKGDELVGGKKISLSFLEALLGEINLANNILRQQNIREAGVKVEEAVERVHSDEYSEATRCFKGDFVYNNKLSTCNGHFEAKRSDLDCRDRFIVIKMISALHCN